MRKKTVKTQTCKEQIQQLNVSEEVKIRLFKIERVASSDNKIIKSSVKDLFISSPSCKELSKIAKCYERIITCNSVYPIRGARTYLEQAFPANGSDKEYKEFFASSKLAAATQDYFTGVFLISFEQWSSANELIREPVFKDLIEFINDNKKHISFVFHVTTDFNGKDMLSNEFSKYVNLYSLEHDVPDIRKTFEYVETKLNEAGIQLDNGGKQELRKLLVEKVDIKAFVCDKSESINKRTKLLIGRIEWSRTGIEVYTIDIKEGIIVGNVIVPREGMNAAGMVSYDSFYDRYIVTSNRLINNEEKLLIERKFNLSGENISHFEQIGL